MSIKKTQPASLEIVSDVPAVQTADPVATQWAKAKSYIDAASLFQRASLAAQVMAGMELCALHKLYDVKHGKRTEINSFHGERSSWKLAVDKHLGISEATAWRWMEMARAARPRLAKSDLQLGEILSKNPTALTAAEQELLSHAVKKITDGRTQLEFMLELGVAKAPQGSGAKGGRPEPKQLPAGEEPADESSAGTDAAPLVLDGARAANEKLIRLLDEQLRDKTYNASDEATRKKLHGYLVDLAKAVKETL